MRVNITLNFIPFNTTGDNKQNWLRNYCLIKEPLVIKLSPTIFMEAKYYLQLCNFLLGCFVSYDNVHNEMNTVKGLNEATWYDIFILQFNFLRSSLLCTDVPKANKAVHPPFKFIRRFSNIGNVLNIFENGIISVFF